MGVSLGPLMGPPHAVIHQPRSWRRDCAAFWLIAASLVFPAIGAAKTEPQESQTPIKENGDSLFSRVFSDSKPPWSVEAPGAAGSRYGLGLDLFSEHQENLRFTFMEQTIRTRDFSGEEILRTDPGLLNRKFDLSLDLAGAGVQPAVALPLPRTLGISSTLVFQAALADVSLDFDDRNRPQDSSSLEGRGPLFGTGIDLTRSLCRSCSWFIGASYLFQRLPSLTVDPSPSFSPPDFEVLEDEVRLSRDVHDASVRIGYGFPGNRIVSYLGVSHRQTDVGIEDHLRYRDPFGEVETTLDSRTQLESEMTLALAGVEARLGPRLFSRLETSVGEGDWGVLLRMLYLPSRSTEKIKGADIAARIREIRNEFVTSVNGFPEGVSLAIVTALLDHIERELLTALPFPEFAAMQDSVRDRFRKAREMLRQGTAGRAALRSPSLTVPVALGLGHSILAEPVFARFASEPDISSGVDSIIALLDLLIKRFENNDTEIHLCVRTTPEQKAAVVLYPLSYTEDKNLTRSNDTLPLRRGLYAYAVTLSGYETLECPFGQSEDCRLDLLSRDRPLVECTLSKSKNVPEATCIVTDEPSGRWRCKIP